MKIYVEDIENLPAVLVQLDSEPAPTGYDNDYVEVVEIEDILKYGLEKINPSTKGWYDKKCLRDMLKIAVYTKMQILSPSDVDNVVNWGFLNDAEKSIAAHWFLIGREEFLLEVVNDLRYWTIEAMNYRNWTMEARSNRLNMMEAIVFMRIVDLSYAKDVLADLSQITKDTVIDIDDVTNKLNSRVRIKRMTRMYIDGLESEAHDGVVAIIDYIDETAGTPFQNGNGFRGLDASKFRDGHSPDSVADELLEVMEGTY
ncbi:MAG: hypothetical protein ACTSPB_15600 [Candidatus Thorarchaeota archaeon]